MLVLSRKEGERIIIGHGITITVVEISRGRVKLAFDCPAEIPIYREEIWQSMAGRIAPEMAPASASRDEACYVGCT